MFVAGQVPRLEQLVGDPSIGPALVLPGPTSVWPVIRPGSVNTAPRVDLGIKGSRRRSARSALACRQFPL